MRPNTLLLALAPALSLASGACSRNCPEVPPQAAAPPVPAAGTAPSPVASGGSALAPSPAPPPGADAETFVVDAEVGNSTFNAVFDAPLGERISAVSSSIGCELTVDDKLHTAAGRCSVPLTSIRVDSEETKTEHFQQWATNKKGAPKDCKFEAAFDGIHLEGPLTPEKAVPFAAEATLKVCGRARADGGKEVIRGTAMVFPPGAYGDVKTIRVQARIEKWNRDLYKVGPKYTDGWLARVQSLANVVADEGTIDLRLFAKAAK